MQGLQHAMRGQPGRRGGVGVPAGAGRAAGRYPRGMDADTTQLACPHCLTINRVPDARLGEGPRCGRCHQPLFTGQPVALTAGNAEAFLLRSEQPAVIDAWAGWCGPCRSFAPVFAAACQRLEPQFRFLKLDTEAEPQLATQFRIQSLPTLIAWQGSREGGHEVARISGALPLPAFMQWLAQSYGLA